MKPKTSEVAGSISTVQDDLCPGKGRWAKVSGLHPVLTVCDDGFNWILSVISLLENKQEKPRRLTGGA
jgi:hypothetical protein